MYRKTIVTARISDPDGTGRGDRIDKVIAFEDFAETPPLVIPEMAPGEGIRYTITIYRQLPETDGSRLFAAMRDHDTAFTHGLLDRDWPSVAPETRAKFEEWAAMGRR